MATEITTSPIAALSLGDYLMTYDEEGDGEAGTYDECEYDALERRALAHIQASLPAGWRAGTETDEDGAYLVARCEETGRVVTDLARIA
jgi:hypothetical protein